MSKCRQAQDEGPCDPKIQPMKIMLKWQEYAVRRNNIELGLVGSVVQLGI
jgi:hypothetical protein